MNRREFASLALAAALAALLKDDPPILVDGEDTLWAGSGLDSFGVIVYLDDQRVFCHRVELYSDGSGVVYLGDQYAHGGGMRAVSGRVRIEREHDAAYSTPDLWRFKRNTDASRQEITRADEYWSQPWHQSNPISMRTKAIYGL